MEYVWLGDRKVSRFGFGGCPLGGHGWGETDEKNLVEAINTAFDAGVTFYDTADVYGLGHSEELLGEVLRTRRQEVVFATKFGVRRVGEQTKYDNSREWIRASAEGSLKRLRTDCIDLYQLHYWDQHTALAEVVETLQGLRAEGKIRAFGVTNIDPREISPDPVDGLVSFSMEYNLLRQHRTQDIREIEATDLTFLSWGSLAQGALSGKYQANSPFQRGDRRSSEAYFAFHGEGLIKREVIVSRLREIAPKYYGRTLAQLAIRWILDAHPTSVALVGMKSPAQVLDIVGAFDWSLDPDDSLLLSETGTSPRARSRPAVAWRVPRAVDQE